MCKKYIIVFCIVIGSILHIALQADSSCSTLCPTCPKRFLQYCRLCKYRDGILKAKCQNADKPAAFVTTSCPVKLNDRSTPVIDNVDGKLECQSTAQETPPTTL